MKPLEIIRTLIPMCLALGAHVHAGAGGFVSLKTSDNTSVRAYVAGPENAKAGVLVVHDFLGITNSTLLACERLASRGYRALAIDLYNGQSGKNNDEGARLMALLQAQNPQMTKHVLQAGVDALEHPGRRLATLGFSMGGIYSLNANLNAASSIHAAVIVYGFEFGQLDAARWGQLKGPLLTIAGSQDEGPMKEAQDLFKNVQLLPQPWENVVIPGVGHGYAQPLFSGGANYSVSATQFTWRVLEDFLERSLKKQNSNHKKVIPAIISKGENHKHVI